jgi:hypothetical protein
LLACPTPDAELLVEHLLAAGDRERARGFAGVAAVRAEEGLAFDRAAELYRQALELSGWTNDEARALRCKLGDALANAARGAEAAGIHARNRGASATKELS